MEKTMQIIGLITLVMELVNQAMETAEKLCDPSTGKLKKELVLSAVKSAVGEDLYAKIEKWLSVFVNVKALVKFGSSGKDPV